MIMMMMREIKEIDSDNDDDGDNKVMIQYCLLKIHC